MRNRNNDNNPTSHVCNSLKGRPEKRTACRFLERVTYHRIHLLNYRLAARRQHVAVAGPETHITTWG